MVRMAQRFLNENHGNGKFSHHETMSVRFFLAGKEWVGGVSNDCFNWLRQDEIEMREQFFYTYTYCYLYNKVVFITTK